MAGKIQNHLRCPLSTIVDVGCRLPARPCQDALLTDVERQQCDYAARQPCISDMEAVEPT